MLRKWLGAGAALTVMLAGCREPKGACDTDADCGSGQTCDVQAKLCFLTVTQFTGFEFVYPQGLEGAVRSGPVKLRARLVPPASDAAPNFPQTVGFKVSQTGTVLAEGVLTHTGEGNYEGDWTAPGGDGVYELTLSYDEASLSETKQFRTDNTKPRFAVTVPVADAGVSPPDSGVTYADPQLPNAWRRDQVVAVTVTADEAIAASSVKLIVHGLDAGTAVEEFPVTQSATCASKFCGVAAVDLAKPGMNAFRGNFPLEVRGADLAGNDNAGASAGAIPVTRWKWAFDGGAGSIQTSPALGSDGSIYFGTASSAVAGEVFALRPSGSSKWAARVQLGAVKASPSVGRSNAGTERLYVAVNGAAGGALHSLSSTDGSQGPKCGPFDGVTFESSLSLLSSQSLENAVTVANLSSAGGGTLTSLRPEAGVTQRCTSSVTVGNIVFPGAVSAVGSNVYFGVEVEKTVRAYSFTDSGWEAKAGWTEPADLFTRALAITTTSILGGARDGGALFSLGFDGGAAARTTNTAEGWNPSVGPTGEALLGLTGSFLLRAPASNVTNATPPVESAGVTKGAPLFGQNSIVYSATSAGTLEVRGRDFSSLWVVTGLGAVEGSPAIDCARPAQGGPAQPGRPGVLYVPSTNGRLYAVVVDSRGIDATAPWPKYQHDPRNTGNADVSLTEFACP